jgi:hypothetical protein
MCSYAEYGIPSCTLQFSFMDRVTIMFGVEDKTDQICLFLAGWLVGWLVGWFFALLFNHEDGYCTFIQNLYQTTWCYIPEDSWLHISV